MARKLHLVLLLAGALAMVSLTYCAAEGDQTLEIELGRRMLLSEQPVMLKKGDPEQVKLAGVKAVAAVARNVERQCMQGTTKPGKLEGAIQSLASSTHVLSARHAKCYDRAGCDICSAWKRKGYCGAYTYKYYSVPNFWCQQTCCTCNACVDLYPKACYEWACKGYCAPKWTYNGYSVYKVICPKTCGYCH